VRRILLLMIFVSGAVSAAPAQGIPLPATAPARPVATADGILLSDQTGDAIYLLNPGTGGTETLFRGSGSGRWNRVSPDGSVVGFKFIGVNGLQSPALFDLSTRTYTTLGSPARRAGQVSFSGAGAIAYTVEEELVVRDASGRERRFDLGSYANLAPISPDGRFAAFNDPGDRIWIIDLETRSRTPVTPAGTGFFNPQWSPDGSRLLCSRLDGEAVICVVGGGPLLSLGEAADPSWSPDGRSVVFTRKEVRDGILVNSDLYAADPSGTGVRNLTATPDLTEFDPSLAPDGRTILYHTGETGVVVRQGIREDVTLLPPSSRQEFSVSLAPGATGHGPLEKSTAADWLDIPYVNQVYDTPDWFNGRAACGPTTSIMLLAYWNVLPEWETSCSWPSFHVNRWGNYVSERYNFRWFDYGLPANDPNGRPAYGGYGFMWTGSYSPHARMVEYYGQHGIAASMTDAPGHSTAVSRIGTSPYSLCNGLTTAGHIVLAHGVDAEPHTFIVNDPYGDKNRTDLGYPNYAGKNAKYDWPGYNNGNQNFNTVYWAVDAAFTPPVQGDTLVDDLQFQRGFYLNNRPPAGMVSWKTLKRGYNGHLWYAYTKAGPIDTCYAIWTPNLPQEGAYEIFAFVSISNATAATYKVNTLDGVRSVVVDQKAVSENWLSLGTFRLGAGPAGTVRLGDVAPERGKEIVFDALRWSYRGSTTAADPVPVRPASLRLLPNYPNPFNPSTTVRFEVPAGARIRVDVVNTLGQVVALLADGFVPAGMQEMTWNAAGLPSGVYRVRLRGEEGCQSRNMLLVK
jgi:hypothetical protein